MKSSSSSAPTSKLLTRLQRLVKDNTTATGISRELGRSDGWFGHVLSGRLDLEFERIEAALATLDVPLHWFFDWAFEDEAPADPAAVLKALCTGTPAPGSLKLLGQIRQFLAKRSGVAATSPLHELPSELAAIDDLRFRDRHAARAQVETYIREILTLEEPVAEDRERLAVAIAIWGSILRCLEEVGDAAAAFPLAVQAAGATAQGWTLGIVLQRSALLLKYHGEVRQALRFCGLSADCFLVQGQLECFGRTLVDKATLLVQLGSYDEAKGMARASVKVLDPTDWRNHVAAQQVLSACAREEGDLEAAREHLEEALRLFGDRSDSSKAHLCWSMARLMKKADQLNAAIPQLETAFGWMTEFGMPVDIGLLALDLAQAYLQANERGKLQQLSATLMTLSPILRRHVLVDRVLMEFVRFAVAGDLSPKLIELARKKIVGASPKARPAAP